LGLLEHGGVKEEEAVEVTEGRQENRRER